MLRLELGGKAPFIVMEDADINEAVEAAVQARYTNCGQVCTCSERIYVHRAIADEFTDRFVTASWALSIGGPLENPDIGAKISRGEVDKIKSIVDAGIAAGAEVLLEGGPLSSGRFGKGFWCAPTVLAVDDDNSPLMQQEVFGPVVPIKTIGDFDEAITLANNTEYDLSAYIFNRSNGEQVQGFHTGWGKSGLGGEDGRYDFEGYLQADRLRKLGRRLTSSTACYGTFVGSLPADKPRRIR